MDLRLAKLVRKIIKSCIFPPTLPHTSLTAFSYGNQLLQMTPWFSQKASECKTSLLPYSLNLYQKLLPSAEHAPSPPPHKAHWQTDISENILVGGGGGWMGGLGFCHHVAAFVIPFNLIYATIIHDYVLKKKWKKGGGGGWGSVDKIFATIMLKLCFPLIWYAIWLCSEKIGFWHVDPIPRVGRDWGSAGKTFATILLLLWFPLIWYATWPCSENVEFRPFDPQGRGGWVCGQNICYHHVVAFLITFHLLSNMTMFWKTRILTPPRWGVGGGIEGLRAKYLLPIAAFVIPFNPLIWYASWLCYEKVEFWHVDPIPMVWGGGGLMGDWGSAGKISK